MNASVMQPYLFPHLAYFQLIEAVDHFVVYDDAQWIQRGWINRNRILLGGEPHLFTFSVAAGSSRSPIREREFAPRMKQEVASFLKTLRHAYGKAPRYEETASLIGDILREIAASSRNVAEDIALSLRRLASYMGITSSFDFSSKLVPKKQRKGEEHIIALCETLEADTYTNPLGGMSLYDASSFAASGIDLRFLKPEPSTYDQQAASFVPNLSVIDALMFNDESEVRALLAQYALVCSQDDGTT